MANAHAVPRKAADGIAVQAQLDIDISKDYDLIVKVRDGVVHTYGLNSKQRINPCVECERFSELMKSRYGDDFEG